MKAKDNKTKLDIR